MSSRKNSSRADLKVLFRCDSTKAQGLGHVVRCLALAEAAVERGWETVLAGRIDNPLGRAMVERSSMTLLPRPVDAIATAALARRLGADMVHFDGYEGVAGLRDELSSAGVQLSSMEDGSFGRRAADLAVDPSAGAELEYRPLNGAGRLARGTDFIPLRGLVRQLRRGRAAEHAHNELPRVVVVMGGTDARDATRSAVELWAMSGVPSHCTAVVPHPHDFQVPELPGGMHLEVAPQSSELPRLLSGADLVVSGSGTTVWELAALGVPMALIQLVENQSQNYGFAVDHEIALGLGDIGSAFRSGAGRLRSLLRDADSRAAMAHRARRVVDGDGSQRIVDLWAEMLSKGGRAAVAVREATASDASQLFEWRNDPNVRAASRSTEELSWETHISWLKSTLMREEVVLLLAEVGGAAAGTVRFDALGPGRYEVSITLASQLRGRGRGREILTAAESWLQRAKGHVELRADMRVSNRPSHRLFTGAGYVAVGGHEAPDGDGWHHLVKVPDRSNGADH